VGVEGIGCAQAKWCGGACSSASARLPSRVDRAQVRALLKAKADLVLRELREELERTTGVAISQTQM
jgi:hypothetical protein